jgi:hypothetical protein
MLKLVIAAALASAALATPASALTVLFGGKPGNFTSQIHIVEGVTFTVTGAAFTGNPAGLTNISQLGSPLQLRRTTPGLGVVAGGSGDQVDTNQTNRREALIVSASEAFEISGLKLSYVDANDTLMLYGLNPDGSLDALSFGGTIKTGLANAAIVSFSNANNGTASLLLKQATGYYQGYVFTTRVGGEVLYNGDRGQGYRLDSLTADVVPEPTTWVLLIAGFGLVGVAARRRRHQTA